MNKNLLIMGLIVCMAGSVAFAEETVSTNVLDSAANQVEIQNTLDRTNFENARKNEKFNRSFREGNVDRIKYDNSVNTNKYKNFDKKKLDKKVSDKRPNINDKRFDKNFKGQRPDQRFGQKPDPRFGQRPPKYGDFRKPHKPYDKVGRHHKPSINNYKKHSKNTVKPNNRKVHNRSIKRV